MKDLIVYFSLEGNTEYVAKRISERNGADLLKLIPKKAYHDKGLAKFVWGGKSALMAEKPELEETDVDLSLYDRIIFGFPVWASSFAPTLRTFINDHAEELKGKKIAAYACQSGNGAEKAFVKLAKCIGIESFDKEAIFIDPKGRPGEDKNQQIDMFGEELSD